MKSTEKILGSYRRQQIVLLLQSQGTVRVADLAQRFGVTEVTIRRDLEALEASGLVQRVHGGAMLPDLPLGPDYTVRQDLFREAKQRIARATVALLAEGEAVLLDVGTTTAAVAEELVGRSGLTVITNSLPALQLLSQAPRLTVVSTGGVVHPGARALVGHITLQTLREVHADRVILSAGGVSVEGGVTVPQDQLVPVKQAMIQAAREVILVADHSKLGRTTLYRVAPLQAVHVLVTDREADPAQIATLEQAGLRVILA